MSFSKRITFYFILFIIPVLLIVLAELGLRYFEYGGNLDLFVHQQNGSVDEYILNKNFTKKYFFQKGIKTPIPISQKFSYVKSDSTYRIFCLGASTVQAFPYKPSGGFPAMLENILRSVHPQKNIEVVNCGITAISSYSVVDIAKEVLEKYNPDLLIVYSGHNEFYGVFGQASRLSFFNSPFLMRTFLKLQDFKLVLLIRDVINSVTCSVADDVPISQSGTMMGLVAEDVEVKYNDEKFKLASETFYENISEIVDCAKEYDTELILCNLVSNQGDFSPFASCHYDNFDTHDSLSFSTLMTSADEYTKVGNYETAITEYNKALLIDSTFADLHFTLGQCYYKSGKFVEAKKHFNLASDYDVVRFRAPSEFNLILKDVAEKHQVPLVDLNTEFSKLSDGNIIGNNLILEHVHPNLKGYFHIAKSIANLMAAKKMISEKWESSKSLSDSQYIAMSNVTLLDQEIAAYSIYKLEAFWPFNARQRGNDYQPVGNSRTEELAKSFIDSNKISLPDLHIKYGAELEKQNKFGLALAEYESALSLEQAAEVYNRLGRLYLAQTEIAYRDLKNYRVASENFRESEYYFIEGLRRFPEDLQLNFNIGLLYFMRNDRLGDAEKYFNIALKIDPKHKNSLRQLSELFFRENRFEDAGNLLKTAIEYYPETARFYTDYGIALMNQNKLTEARIYLKKAIDMKNDLKAKYFIQQLNAQIRNIKKKEVTF